MKKLLLTGAALMALSFGARAQFSCAEALELPIGITTVGTIAGDYYAEGCFATTSTTNPDAATAANWYKVTAPANGAFRINTNVQGNDPEGDTRVAVYSGTCDALTCWTTGDDKYFNIIYDDQGNPISYDPNNVLYADFEFPVVAGQTYYIAFDDAYVDTGFDVELTFNDPSCVDNSLHEDWTNLANWYFCWARPNPSTTVRNKWQLMTDYDFGGTDYNYDNTAAIFSAQGTANDDFLISSEKNLVGGTEYTLNVTYNGVNTQTQAGAVVEADESFEVYVFNIVNNSYTPVALIGEETGIAQSGTDLNVLKENATLGSYTFTPDADGEYFFGIHSTSQSGGALLVFEVNVDGAMGTVKNDVSNIAVFPNPTSNVVNVASAGALVNNVAVTDLNGRTVKSAKFDGVTNAQVNISDLASGVYMMTISSDKGTSTKKIVKN
ncbi:T9SS type A sorting domain-containing protein [Flavobacterium psychrotrophum]|uniref:T9SS type A sorting domain-containing protein n=1 Tax=Flavobacterium psychrotrophum TaxID=2294119 RepID=UPI000E316273|nr:T9SS type A sorting domain-containing protein [Flavobacterium psychrotrophum]